MTVDRRCELIVNWVNNPSLLAHFSFRKSEANRPLVPALPDRGLISLSDGKVDWRWETNSLRALFRGDKQPPVLGDHPRYIGAQRVAVVASERAPRRKVMGGFVSKHPRPSHRGLGLREGDCVCRALQAARV